MGLPGVNGKSKERGVYGGGDGGSIDTAVLVSAPNALVGVRAEYEYVELKHGRKDTDWSVESQAIIEQGGRKYDLLSIKLSSGQSQSYYFDVTQSFGKFPDDPANASQEYIEALCPHCRQQNLLFRKKLLGVSEVFICASCSKFSRSAGIWGRAFGIAVLLPFTVVLAAAVATGIYFLYFMFDGGFSAGFAAIGLFLILVPGFAAYRTILTIRRLLRLRQLIPTDGFQTSI